VIVVDASVWVSGLSRRDAHHPVSRAWLARQLTTGVSLVGPALVLAEVAGAVARTMGRPRLGHRARRLLERLPGFRVMEIDSRLGAIAAEIAATLRLRGSDAMYVAVAHVLGASLVTWDIELRERGRRMITVRTPAEDETIEA
jgi:predicted nucleic acid-binding protein